eukprot:COSAG06_NODE_1832_length_8261_cov_31.690112_10_plen_105_part_00
MAKLRSNTVNAVASSVCSAVDSYLQVYGHQGYSMDFVEPTQVEDPSALFGTLHYTMLHPTQRNAFAAEVAYYTLLLRADMMHDAHSHTLIRHHIYHVLLHVSSP